MGSELIARGLPQGAPADMVTIQYPQQVADVHRAYRSAGAGVLKTNTFNANPLRLAQCQLLTYFAALNRQAVELARAAAAPADNPQSPARIAGVLGPTGVLLPPAGAGDVAEIQNAFVQQARLLADAGVDLLLVETMYDLREALAALAGCRSATALPVIVTLTFTRTPRGFLTQTGDAAGDALKALADAGADAVGSNCSLDCATMAALARRMRAFLPDTPLLIQPCAGQPRAQLDHMEYPDSPEDFADHQAQLAALGVELLGGCCGTSPAHLAALARRCFPSDPPSR